jgi:hypothetical protein
LKYFITNLKSELVGLVKKVDPRLDRSIFVFNKIADQIKGFTNTRELNRYLSSTAFPEAQYFFVTAASQTDRTKFRQKSAFKKRLEELQQVVILLSLFTSIGRSQFHGTVTV